MKKIINKTIFSLCLFIVSFIYIDNVSANTINDIEIDVYINNEGTAIITETRMVTLITNDINFLVHQFYLHHTNIRKHLPILY